MCSFSWNVFIRKHMKKNLLKLSKKKICRNFCVVFFQISLDFIQEKKLYRNFFLFCNFILKCFVFFNLISHWKRFYWKFFSRNNSAKKKVSFSLEKTLSWFFSSPEKRKRWTSVKMVPFFILFQNLLYKIIPQNSVFISEKISDYQNWSI